MSGSELSGDGYSVEPVGGRLAAWQAAAVDRGYTYQAVDESGAAFLTGLMFRDGEDISVTSVIDGSLAPAPFIAGNVTGRYTVDERVVTTAFVAIPLARSMPSIVLVNAQGGAMSEAAVGMGSRQMLSLAGDFDRSFTLYCPLGHSEQAKSVFTPELMQLFRDAAPGADVELVNDWMFIYVPGEKFEPQDAFDRVERVARRVHETIVATDHFVGEGIDASATRLSAPVAGAVQVLAVVAFGLLLAAIIGLTIAESL